MAKTLLLVLLLLATNQLRCVRWRSTGVVEGKRPPVDYDALDKAWEAGDAREELRSAGDEQFDALASKSEEEAKALGPQMVFVTLRSDRENADEGLAAIASRWKEALWNGGVDVTVYEIEAGAKLLVGLQRGARVAALRRFLLEQPEVREVEWDRQTFSPQATGASHSLKLQHASSSSSNNNKKKSKAHRKRVRKAAEAATSAASAREKKKEAKAPSAASQDEL
ncbi:hypothetical protein PybrP1_012916 [[Pythium] brassicae (nom. inval.)]|nr:hypothetical protein PybrP1_012916 [[Pythium] brassicae (nom. inval.)]